jgi:hypothetical protein
MHPEPDIWRRYLRCEVNLQRRTALTTHLAACPGCCGLLARLPPPPVYFAGRPFSAMLSPEPSAVRARLRTLQATWSAAPPAGIVEIACAPGDEPSWMAAAEQFAAQHSASIAGTPRLPDEPAPNPIHFRILVWLNPFRPPAPASSQRVLWLRPDFAALTCQPLIYTVTWQIVSSAFGCDVPVDDPAVPNLHPVLIPGIPLASGYCAPLNSWSVTTQLLAVPKVMLRALSRIPDRRLRTTAEENSTALLRDLRK